MVSTATQGETLLVYGSTEKCEWWRVGKCHLAGEKPTTARIRQERRGDLFCIPVAFGFVCLTGEDI